MKVPKNRIKTDNRLKCKDDDCDNGIDCWNRSQPKPSQCRKCLCYSCIYAKCGGSKLDLLGESNV